MCIGGMQLSYIRLLFCFAMASMLLVSLLFNFQEILKTYTSQQDVLPSLETSLEQLGADANQRAKVEMLKERFRQLEENDDLEAWLAVYQLFFEEVRWTGRQKLLKIYNSLSCSLEIPDLPQK